MYFELKDKTADVLARCRRREQLCDRPLDLISSQDAAYGIQAIAEDLLGFERKGFALVGSSEPSRRILGLTKPVFSEIPASALIVGVKQFGLPPGAIGAQGEFVFRILRPFPEAGEAIDRASVASAVLGCHPAIGILGRRTRQSFVGNNAAIVDFGLHVATLCGPCADAIDLDRLADIEVNVFLFGDTVFAGSATSILGHPLEAVVWLANELSARGKQLKPSDFVATGSCTTILQVLPGQHLAADFGPLGQVDCIFS
ncbi:MAG: hydratase [Rhizobium sp.]|uniref:2-keto-4-pentenoate hydratase n=1 Tax=Rhizobium sp. TaxID=391 RepID=UPI00064848D7